MRTCKLNFILIQDGYEREIEFLPGENRTLRTLSLTPKVFGEFE